MPPSDPDRSSKLAFGKRLGGPANEYIVPGIPFKDRLTNMFRWMLPKGRIKKKPARRR